MVLQNEKLHLSYITDSKCFEQLSGVLYTLYKERSEILVGDKELTKAQLFEVIAEATTACILKIDANT